MQTQTSKGSGDQAKKKAMQRLGKQCYIQKLWQSPKKKSDNSKKCLEEIFDLVLSLDGTLSGEHGIGIIKKSFINKEIDSSTLSLMSDIKKQFDPKNILNPNKSI